VWVGSVELRLKVLSSLDIVEAERVRRRVSRPDSRVRVTFRTRSAGRCSTDCSDSLMRFIEAGDRATVKDGRRNVREACRGTSQ
jgi:thiamine monophosphate kinase